ncbi:MAG: hypothetical protein MUC88_05520 [Planctomycetes bacterium]|nr:hypothetical protein [Planctomycetota bacterium]
MDNHTERIEQYLQGIGVPACGSDLHRQRLRRQILGEIERRQTMSARGKAWRIAAMIALIGTGAVMGAAGMKMQRYRFVERQPQRGYVVQSEDGRNTMLVSEVHANTPEEAVQYAEKLAMFKQQGRRRLVGVVETAVNGQHDMRVLTYEYRLPNGQTTYLGERDPNDTGPATLANERLEAAFREIDERNIVSYERDVQGRRFSFQARQLVLDDGTQILRAYGRPKDAPEQAGRASEILWHLELTLEMQGLKPPALQWAVFDEDPLPGFVERLERRRKTLPAAVKAAPEQEEVAARNARISVNWDLAFRKITADEAYLLTPAPRGSHGYTTNGPAGPKWIVTKTVMIDGKPHCWCVPVEVKAGKEIALILRAKNITDLTGIYDEVMNAPSPEK